MIEVRRAVLAGHKLRIHYAATGQAPQWRTVDPIGLVTVRDRGYLLATRAGADRTYRLSRVLAAEELPEPAQRPDRVDLDRIWRERCAQFLSDGHSPCWSRVDPARREELLSTAVAVRAEEPEADGWLRLEVTFQDSWHAEWALWQLGPDAEALAPQSLRIRSATVPPRSPPATKTHPESRCAAGVRIPPDRPTVDTAAEPAEGAPLRGQPRYVHTSSERWYDGMTASEIMGKVVVVHTDGACSPKPRAGRLGRHPALRRRRTRDLRRRARHHQQPHGADGGDPGPGDAHPPVQGPRCTPTAPT